MLQPAGFAAFLALHVTDRSPSTFYLVAEAFKRDESPDKLNLGVGAYRTEELKPYMLEVVKKVRSCSSARLLNP